MSKLNKWVDVRKKQIREAIDVKITIKKLDELNCYFTVKEINQIDEKFSMFIEHPEAKKMDKNYKMLEYTPIDKNYNVRAYVNDENDIFQYYLDITDGMELREGVPYYNDLYLDIIYYKDKKYLEKYSKSGKELRIIDQEELEEALEQKIITKEQYDSAYNIANQLVDEIKNGSNVFINRGIEDYLNLKNN